MNQQVPNLFFYYLLSNFLLKADYSPDHYSPGHSDFLSKPSNLQLNPQSNINDLNMTSSAQFPSRITQPPKDNYYLNDYDRNPLEFRNPLHNGASQSILTQTEKNPENQKEKDFSDFNFSYNLREPFDYKQPMKIEKENTPEQRSKPILDEHFSKFDEHKDAEDYKTNPFSTFEDDSKGKRLDERAKNPKMDWLEEKTSHKPPKIPQNLSSGEKPKPILKMVTPQKVARLIDDTKEKTPDQDFKSQLPHYKERSQNAKLINSEEAIKRFSPKMIESRKEFANDKGFYNEGRSLTKEPPKKANFEIEDSKVNPFGSTSINIEDFKNNATFSRHIFEDQTIVDILEKKAGKKPESEKDMGGEVVDFGIGKKTKDIIQEKNGRVVREKGESHADPYARLAHIIFKLFSLISYLVLSSSSSSDNIIYQAVIIFSALDFWTVKNVSARLLIGYRYWCEFSSTGKERWVFETFCERGIKENKTNTRFFWIVQTAFSIAWFFYAMYELFSLEIAMTICLGLGFAGCLSNLLIFRRCEQIKKKNLDELFLGMSQLDKTLYLIRGSIKLPLFKDAAKFRKKN